MTDQENNGALPTRRSIRLAREAAEKESSQVKPANPTLPARPIPPSRPDSLGRGATAKDCNLTMWKEMEKEKERLHPENVGGDQEIPSIGDFDDQQITHVSDEKWVPVPQLSVQAINEMTKRERTPLTSLPAPALDTLSDSEESIPLSESGPVSIENIGDDDTKDFDMPSLLSEALATEKKKDESDWEYLIEGKGYASWKHIPGPMDQKQNEVRLIWSVFSDEEIGELQSIDNAVKIKKKFYVDDERINTRIEELVRNLV